LPSSLMAEADGAPVRRAPPKDGEAYSNLSFTVMENVLEKLKILNYERDFCKTDHSQLLTRTAFALPWNNPSVQFGSLQDVVSWLAFKATNDRDAFKVDQYDDPNTSVNKMMLMLRNMGFTLDFPVVKLKQGHGESVCSVLDFLADKALEAEGFAWAAPVHEDTPELEEAEVDEEADLGDIEDEAEVMEEEEAMFADLAEEEDEVLEQSTHQLIENTIDPLVWKTELERVGPRLKANVVSLGKEWRAHIEQTKDHEKTIQATLPAAQSHMQSISEQIKEAVEKMRSQEHSINTHFDAMRSEYEVLRSELKTVEQKYRGSSENVAHLTNKMSTIQDQLDELKSEMNSRESSATDTSPLVSIKHALQNIKGEVREFDLRIGVVSHTLMQAKLRVTKRKLKKSKHGSKHHVEEKKSYDFDQPSM